MRLSDCTKILICRCHRSVLEQSMELRQTWWKKVGNMATSTKIEESDMVSRHILLTAMVQEAQARANKITEENLYEISVQLKPYGIRIEGKFLTRYDVYSLVKIIKFDDVENLNKTIDEFDAILTIQVHMTIR